MKVRSGVLKKGQTMHEKKKLVLKLNKCLKYMRYFWCQPGFIELGDWSTVLWGPSIVKFLRICQDVGYTDYWALLCV